MAILSSLSRRRLLRQIHHFSTTTTTTTTTTTAPSKPLSISLAAAKSKLRNEFDPDKALAIYSSISSHYSSPHCTRYTQDLTIKRLLKSKRFADIETLLESHKTDPKITQEPFVCTLIRSYGQAGMADRAIKTFQQMDELGAPRSVMSFNVLLSACNQAKKFDQVPNLFSEIPKKYSISPNQVSYGILIKSLCESGSSESSYPILKEMEEKNIEITAVTYTTLLDSAYKNGKTEEADNIWNQMVSKGCSLDVVAYNVKIRHFADHGKPEDVLKLIDEMIASEIKPDVASYNSLLTRYCKNDMIEDAKKVYESLKEKGCLPNAATFRTLIYQLCEKGDFDTALEVCKRSIKMNKIPHFGTMSCLVEGLVKGSKVAEAKGLIEEVKKRFPESKLNEWKKLESEYGLK